MNFALHRYITPVLILLAVNFGLWIAGTAPVEGAVPASSIDRFLNDFDKQGFALQALGTDDFNSLSKSEQIKLEDILVTRIRNKFSSTKWTLKSDWKKEGRDWVATFNHSENGDLGIRIVSHPRVNKFVDVKISGHSLLVNVAGTLQKQLLRQSASQIVKKLSEDTAS